MSNPNIKYSIAPPYISFRDIVGQKNSTVNENKNASPAIINDMPKGDTFLQKLKMILFIPDQAFLLHTG